jgi:hypothetical protein
MDPMLAAWIADSLIAGLVLGGAVRLVLRLDINARLFGDACRRLLEAENYDRFEKLLAANRQWPPLMEIVAAAWQKRGAPAPVEPSAFGGYREAEAPPSYAERMKRTLAPDLAAARRKVRGAFLLTLAAPLAPLLTLGLIGPPPPLSGPWIVTLVAVFLAALSWRVAAKILRSFEPILDALLPLMENATREG